jgi:hypothetical protein
MKISFSLTLFDCWVSFVLNANKFVKILIAILGILCTLLSLNFYACFI